MNQISPIICGASGRMGKELFKLATNEGIQIGGACTRSSSSMFGQEVAGIKVTNSIEEALRNAPKSDAKPVIIDFSSVDALIQHADEARKLGIPYLAAVSGLREEHWNHLKGVSTDIPVLVALNTSIGANLLAVLSGLAAQILKDADIEIIETHHNKKKDSPSGTAFLLADHIAKAREVELGQAGCFNRRESGARKTGEIGVFGLRGGNVIGNHTVNLFDADETIELTHRVGQRSVFAKGAITAAKFLAEQKPGLYNMLDVFKIKNLNA